MVAQNTKPKKPDRFWFHRFHYGLRSLKKTCSESCEIYKSEIERIHENYNKHREKVELGEANEVEEGPDGEWVYDYGEHAGELITDAEDTLEILRQTFMISLYHFWEKQVGSRLADSRYTQPAAFKWIVNHNGTPDKKLLTQLRLAANCAKHGNTSQLYRNRPDMFDQRKIEDWGVKPSQETLLVSDATLYQFFDAVESSIHKPPKGSSLWD